MNRDKYYYLRAKCDFSHLRELLTKLPVRNLVCVKWRAQSIYRLKCQFSLSDDTRSNIIKNFECSLSLIYISIDVDGHISWMDPKKEYEAMSQWERERERVRRWRGDKQRAKKKKKISQTVKMFTHFSRLSSETTFMFCFTSARKTFFFAKLNQSIWLTDRNHIKSKRHTVTIWTI